MTTGQFWVAIAVVINMWVNIGVMVFFQRCRLKQLELYLSGGECVEWKRTVWEGGYIGRQMRLNTIVNIIILPRFYYRMGEIEQDADKRIPIKLRRQLLAAYAHMFLTMFAMVVLYFTLPDKGGA